MLGSCTKAASPSLRSLAPLLTFAAAVVAGNAAALSPCDLRAADATGPHVLVSTIGGTILLPLVVRSPLLLLLLQLPLLLLFMWLLLALLPELQSESSRRKWKRPLVPSFDVHEADRVVSAREKQRRLLRFATAAGDADTWLPDKFYTHELQQPQPWVNPTEVLSRYLTSRQKSSDDELTPRASTSAESSDHDTRTAESSKGTRRKIKKKTQKKRSSSKKKKKKRKKDKG